MFFQTVLHRLKLQMKVRMELPARKQLPQNIESMDKRQIITLSIALVLGVATAQADILKGRVVDADTGEPLQGAEVVFNE